MAHRKNFNVPGNAHELTFTCYRRYPFLAKDRTCRWLADAINAACLELDYQLWAYVFMPDHVHLIVYPNRAEYDIADLRKQIKAPVAKQAINHLQQHAPEWLPRITRQRGSRTERLFWQSGGGYDRNIEDPRLLSRMIDYLHDNPVRKGLVDRPADWAWSSAAWHDLRRPGPCVVHPIGERFAVSY